MYRCLDKIDLEIPSRGTGPTLLGGVWEGADVQTRLIQRFLLALWAFYNIILFSSKNLTNQIS